jgi:hypothetical protein
MSRFLLEKTEKEVDEELENLLLSARIQANSFKFPI